MGVRDRKIKLKDGSVRVMRYITWYEPGTGKAITRSLGPASKMTKTRAKEILAAEKKAAKENRYGYGEDPILKRYSDYYITYVRDVQKKRSWKRDASSLKNLLPALGESKLSEITTKELMLYRERRLESGVSRRTINLELSCLSHIYKVSKEHEVYLGENPVSKIKPFEISYGADRILLPEEEKRLLQASPGHLKPLIICALNTGMRRGEIVSLLWENVKLDHGHILIEATNTKSKKQRRVPINSIMHDLFIELKQGNDTNQVFLNSDGEPYAVAENIRKSFYTARRKAGIPDFRFHDLRHTAATRMVESGVPLFTVGQILGHSDPKMTMRYAHPDESLKDGIEALARYNRDIYRDNNSLSNPKKKHNLP